MLLFLNYTFLFNFAPLIYLDTNEEFFPSSVDYILANTNKRLIGNDTWLQTREKLESPSSVIPYFTGQNSAPIYVIVMPKDLSKPYDSLTAFYMTFYPYNRGKKVLSTEWGNHVSDIEIFAIEFVNRVPIRATCNYHRWNVTKEWDDPSIERVKGTLHPIIYSAQGSHGLWFSEGDHVYHQNPTLIDKTSKGKEWSTWEDLVIITPYDFNYIDWLKIYRWGNPSTDFPIDNCYFGYCRLENGPVGPLFKNLLQN
jgi:hypothetical protein